MRNVSGLETVYRDYAPKGVQLFYVYKSLAHPEVNNYVAPFSLQERRMHIAEFKRLSRSQIPWICDTMDGQLAQAAGDPPNGEFVLDPQGRIVRKRFWSNPATLRRDLAELVGAVDNPTQVSDLDVVFRVQPRELASGVVPRIDIPAGMRALRLEPLADDVEPFYVKLRAEGDRSLLREGTGKLYLGFYLDPLYHVHWNNRAGRLQMEIQAPEEVTVTPSAGVSPEVQQDADVDPRQFLVDVQGGESEQPLDLVVQYIACDDANTFCKPVAQRYRIYLEQDRAGGSRPGVFMPELFANVGDFDRDGDGKITRDELPPGMVSMYIGHIDLNHDQVIDRQEIDTFLRMFNNGAGFSSPRNDGQPEDSARGDHQIP